MPYGLLAPEIAVTSLGLVVLGVGLLSRPRPHPAVRVLAVSGLALVLCWVALTFTRQASFFGGVYQVDSFASFFRLLFLSAALLVLLMSGRYAARFGPRLAEWYAFLLFATAGMMVMAGSGDLIALYVGLELMTVSFYVLSGYLLADARSAEAGLKYLVLGALSSAVMLFGMSLVFATARSTVFTAIAAAVAAPAPSPPALLAGIALLAAGFAFKVAAVPFHMWAPDIYQGAPTPVTAYLAVASKAAAFAALLRVFLAALPGQLPDWQPVVALLAAVTIVAGNLIALAQTDVKRLLAYSSIAQAGYLLVGLSAANPYGLRGVLFYAMLYVFANVGAFAVLTLVEVDTGGTGLDSFNGLGQRAPMLAMVMTVCLLSLAGIPPLAGFAGKFYLFAGAVQAGYLWLAFVGLLMSMVSVYYYLSVAKAMYIGPAERTAPVTVPSPARLCLWVCLAATLAIGIYPGPLSALAQVSALLP
ncbi:MAG: NADH-quinone oxidoreductase subunit N [Syntrophomonadaceae bacterium]|jgi:NADH-quinone oxidoreductase subunit N|nr:NADH-quinone oxidoreductase subunit N [Syntrophomonadaceae bacterium]MDH7496976.1 NADH-quinone oxidoreductase subunit N [Syntrophomonadaceae bacterium]